MSMSLSSSTSDCTNAGGEDYSGSSGVDAVTSVLLMLHRRSQWPMSKLAQHLHVPVFAVEEAMRLGTSSALIRAQFSTWVHDSSELPPSIPLSLVAAALTQCDSTGSFGFDDATLMPGEEGGQSNFGRWDPKLRDHFAFLQQSVGYNFMSVLNDPTELDASNNGKADWGSWLGNVVNQAFDYGNQPMTSSGVPPPTASASPRGGGAGGGAAVFSGGETAACMLQHTALVYPLSYESFQPYLHYIGEVLQTRRAALMEYVRHNEEAVHVEGCTEADPERAPWPSRVDSEFFSESFNPGPLLDRVLPSHDDMSGPSQPVTSPPPLTATAADGSEELLFSKRVIDPARMTECLESVDSKCVELHMYLQQLEHCLFVHVQRKSDEFFAASQAFEELHCDAEAALRDVSRSRADVLTSGDSVVGDFMSLARLYRRRSHLEMISEAMTKVMKVKGLWDRVDSWLSTEERSMEVLPDIARNMMACSALISKEEDSVLFTELKCCKSLPSHIFNGKVTLEGMVQTTGFNAIVASLTQSMSNRSDSVVDWNAVSSALEASCTLGFLAPIIHMFQQHVVDEMWTWTRDVIVSCMDPPAAQQVAKYALKAANKKEEGRHFFAPLKAMKAASYMLMVSRVLGEVQERVACVAEHWEVVREIACGAWIDAQGDGNSKGTPLPPALDTSGFFTALGIAAQHCVMDLISTRYEENSMLRLHEALPLMRTCFQCVAAFESVLSKGRASATSGAPVTPAVGSPASLSKPPKVQRAIGGELRVVLVQQCKYIFHRQHLKLQERVLQAVTTEEPWTPMEVVDPIFQEMCNALCHTDEESLLTFRQMSVECTGTQRQQQQQLPSNDGDEDAAVAGTNRLYVMADMRIDDLVGDDEATGSSKPQPTTTTTTTTTTHGFVVTHSLLLLLQTLNEYRQLLGSFPFMVFDICGKMYEALKLYDGQCAAMILGASAVDLGILESITAQQVALASQCTACLAELTLLLQAQLRILFPSDKLTVVIEQDFDRAHREFVHHRDEFFLKIVSIVRERVEQSTATFDPQQWEKRGNEWVMSMLREMAKALKQIRPVLRACDVKVVMVPMVGYCASKFRERVRLITPAVMSVCKKQVKSDLQLFKVNVDKFGFDALRCMNAWATHAAASSSSPSGTSGGGPTALPGTLLPLEDVERCTASLGGGGDVAMTAFLDAVFGATHS